jgi:ribosomal protein S18 acetylase RimI-like enzyme
LEEILRLYRIASDYQRAQKTVVVWSKFDRELVLKEIEEKHQWKLMIDNKIACVWATTFSDPQIWEERNVDPAIYIHLIAVNTGFRGQSFIKYIVDWAKNHANKLQKEFIRLDTIGENHKLIKYYTSSGFDFLGLFNLKNRNGLTVHYQELPACLFELKV